jgi:2-polyprenyl-6-methoxyphenol hydroxylase-like FAD-dependent oxidoreductase
MPCVSTALIIGGGIAGLSSAIALSRIGVACEVVEKNNPKEGASIGLTGQVVNALDELGLYDLVYNAGHPFHHDSGAASLRDSTGTLLSAFPKPTNTDAKLGVGIYRPALIDLMTKVAVELGVKVISGATFTKIDNGSNGVTVSLTTGEQRTYDILLGADGIASETRRVLFPDATEPSYSGQWSIRWMAPGPPVEPESWYSSPVGRMGFYSLPEGIVYCPSVFNVPDDKRMTDKDVHDLFRSLLDSMTAPAIVELRSRLKSDSVLIGRPFKWILLPDPWYSNRALLVGDAAHATTAHLGMGGGMALEDAVVLAQCIKDANTVEDAFKAFMTRRFERVALVVNNSVKLSNLEQEDAPPAETMAVIGKARAAISGPY